MRYLVMLIFVFSFTFAQQKESQQRYVIVQVDKIEDGYNSEGITKTATATEKKSIILIDTFLGRCWILTPITQKADSYNVESYQWTPIPFSTIAPAIPPK